MRPIFPGILAAVLGAASASLSAQQVPGPQPQQPVVGFFQPKSGDDLSLSRTLPPEAYQPPTAIPPTAPRAPATPLVVVVPPNADTQADRAEAEAQRARAAAASTPQPINGAFTGLTDERDR